MTYPLLLPSIKISTDSFLDKSIRKVFQSLTISWTLAEQIIMKNGTPAGLGS